MQYEGGPVLMMGEYAPHEGAAETAAFEVVEEHDPERMPQVEPVPAPVQKRRLLFVVSQQSNLDRVRKTQLCGVEGRVFKEQYLEPLGITRADVDVIDMSELAEHGNAQPLAVIALGKAARLALGNVADFSLPHPWSIRKSGDKRGELARKFKRIGRLLETAHLS